MKLIIHRGTHEIGGSCIELVSANSRILLDFGLPLVDSNNEQFDSKKIRGKSKDDLIETGVLPRIKGLYRDETPSFDAILLSHPHQDHYGLLSYANPRIPVYLSKGCRILVEVSHFFNQTGCELKNIETVEDGHSFKKGDFTITPFVVDHAGFDALGFLVECGGKKIYYSGDFRGHGRKSKLFFKMLRNPPENVDYLILEGTMIGRDEGQYGTEDGIETKLASLFKSENRLFFYCLLIAEYRQDRFYLQGLQRKRAYFRDRPLYRLYPGQVERSLRKNTPGDLGQNNEGIFREKQPH